MVYVDVGLGFTSDAQFANIFLYQIALLRGDVDARPVIPFVAVVAADVETETRRIDNDSDGNPLIRATTRNIDEPIEIVDFATYAVKLLLIVFLGVVDGWFAGDQYVRRRLHGEPAKDSARFVLLHQHVDDGVRHRCGVHRRLEHAGIPQGSAFFERNLVRYRRKYGRHYHAFRCGDRLAFHLEFASDFLRWPFHRRSFRESFLWLIWDDIYSVTNLCGIYMQMLHDNLINKYV